MKQPITHQYLMELELEITAESRLYGCVLDRCHLKLVGDDRDPRFLLCSLVNCTFDPPLVQDDLDSWRCLRRYGNVVQMEEWE